MSTIYDVIIVGGGPAGYTAAMYASRAGLDTLVIEKYSVGGQMALTGDIDNYPGFEEGIDGFELGIKMQKCAERFGATTEITEVLSLNLSDIINQLIRKSSPFVNYNYTENIANNDRNICVFSDISDDSGNLSILDFYNICKNNIL